MASGGSLWLVSAVAALLLVQLAHTAYGQHAPAVRGEFVVSSAWAALPCL